MVSGFLLFSSTHSSFLWLPSKSFPLQREDFISQEFLGQAFSDHCGHRPVTQKRASTLEVLLYRQWKEYMVLLSMQPLEEWKLDFEGKQTFCKELGSDPCSSPFTHLQYQFCQTGIICCTSWCNAPECKLDQDTLTVWSSQSYISAGDNCWKSIMITQIIMAEFHQKRWMLTFR